MEMSCLLELALAQQLSRRAPMTPRHDLGEIARCVSRLVAQGTQDTFRKHRRHDLKWAKRPGLSSGETVREKGEFGGPAEGGGGDGQSCGRQCFAALARIAATAAGRVQRVGSHGSAAVGRRAHLAHPA